MPEPTEDAVREYLRLAGEATREPWETGPSIEGFEVSFEGPDGEVGECWEYDDVEFIIASRTMGPDLAESWLQQNAEIGRLRAVAEAARLLTVELNDWMIDRARDGWGNTNSNIVQRKRDALLTALEGGGQGE